VPTTTAFLLTPATCHPHTHRRNKLASKKPGPHNDRCSWKPICPTRCPWNTARYPGATRAEKVAPTLTNETHPSSPWQIAP